MRSAVGLFVLLIAAGAVFGENAHPHFWWDHIPAFGAFLGFVGSWVLVLLAKNVLAPLLQRPDAEEDEAR